MTGSPSSNSGTQARHPNLLQQQGCRDNRISDKLRRMAIKNSYESRSLCGASSIEQDTTFAEEKVTSLGKILPSLSGNRPASSASNSNNPHRYSSSRSKRPAQKTLSSPIASSRARSSSTKVHSPFSKSSSTAMHDVGASAGVDPEIIIHNEDKTAASVHQKITATTNTDAGDDNSSTTSSSVPAHLRRSTSHSSVAVNNTASSSLSQPMGGDTSSYIYHIPGRIISRGRSRSQSRVHAHMHTHNVPGLSLKRSSSHSTVALHRTNHYPIPPPSSMSHVPPSSAAPHGHASPAVITPLNYSNGIGPEPLYDSYLNHNHHDHHSSPVYGGGPSYSRSLSQDHYGTAGMVGTLSAYGTRHNKIYEPWSPDIGLIESQFPRMFKHIEHTAPSGSSSSRRRNKHDLPPSAGAMSQPDSLHYSISLPPSSMSSHRHSKKRHSPSSSSHPRSLGELDNGSGMPTTQFGSSSRFQRSPPGIAPHLVTAHSSPPHHHHQHHPHSRAAAAPPPDSLRRKRVTLHPPRGNKVASLV